MKKKGECSGKTNSHYSIQKMSNKSVLSVQNMVLIAVFTAIIAVCSWISVPIGPVPFTLQTFAVFVTAGLLGTKRSEISIIVFIILGTIGVPVFAGFSSGPGVIAGPTGGYIVGFLLTALIIGLIMKLAKGKSEITKIVITVVAMILGDIGCFAIGTVWFMVVMKMNLSASLTLCVVPYIVPDLAKIIVATIIVNRLKKYVKIFN